VRTCVDVAYRSATLEFLESAKYVALCNSMKGDTCLCKSIYFETRSVRFDFHRFGY
jgi:hypothetical protein